MTGAEIMSGKQRVLSLVAGERVVKNVGSRIPRSGRRRRWGASRGGNDEEAQNTMERGSQARMRRSTRGWDEMMQRGEERWVGGVRMEKRVGSWGEREWMYG